VVGTVSHMRVAGVACSVHVERGLTVSSYSVFRRAPRILSCASFFFRLNDYHEHAAFASLVEFVARRTGEQMCGSPCRTWLYTRRCSPSAGQKVAAPSCRCLPAVLCMFSAWTRSWVQCRRPVGVRRAVGAPLAGRPSATRSRPCRECLVVVFAAAPWRRVASVTGPSPSSLSRRRTPGASACGTCIWHALAMSTCDRSARCGWSRKTAGVSHV